MRGDWSVAKNPISDELALAFIKAMVAAVDGGDTAEEAFSTANDELGERIPPGVGLQVVQDDLERRGWIRVTRTKLAEVGNSSVVGTQPIIAAVTLEGRQAAKR